MLNPRVNATSSVRTHVLSCPAPWGVGRCQRAPEASRPRRCGPTARPPRRAGTSLHIEGSCRPGPRAGHCPRAPAPRPPPTSAARPPHLKGQRRAAGPSESARGPVLSRRVMRRGSRPRPGGTQAYYLVASSATSSRSGGGGGGDCLIERPRNSSTCGVREGESMRAGRMCLSLGTTIATSRYQYVRTGIARPPWSAGARDSEKRLR
jgi:hypothetical protein